MITGRLDLGWCWTPELAPGLRELPVAREAVVLVLSAKHELAAEPMVDPARLSGQPLVVVSRVGNPALHDSIVSQLQARGTEVTVAHEVVGIERFFPLVLEGRAVGLAPSSSTAAARPFPGIVYRPMTDPSPSIETRLVWRDDHVSEPAVRSTVSVFRDLIAAGALEPSTDPGVPADEPEDSEPRRGDEATPTSST